MSTKERAAAIRAELKAHGWKPRDVSVRADHFSMGSAVRVTIKNPAVPPSLVKSIAEPHERIARCSRTGEILSGGNTYITVGYDHDTLKAMAAPVVERLRTVADTPGVRVKAADGWEAWKAKDEPGEYWYAVPKGESYFAPDGHIYCWGMEFCAEQLAKKLADDVERCDSCGRGDGHVSMLGSGGKTCQRCAAEVLADEEEDRPAQESAEPAPAPVRPALRLIQGGAGGEQHALPFGLERPEQLSEPFCACGHVVSQCDGSRAGCTKPGGLTPYQQARKERAERRAARLQRAADSKLSSARAEIEHIPPGQPILVGHHSERHHRVALDRHDRKMRAGIELARAADRAQGAVARAGEAVSGDDPDAVPALRAKLAEMERKREELKAYNRAARNRGEETLPSYMLSNLGANIRRVKGRIAELDAEPPAFEAIEGDGWRVEARPDINRIAIVFDERQPRERTRELKRHGFKWSRREQAWIRMLNRAGISSAQYVAGRLLDGAI